MTEIPAGPENRLQEILEGMTDGLWTVKEAEAQYVAAGGELGAFISYATMHREQCFHGDPVSGDPVRDPLTGEVEVWPYPAAGHVPVSNLAAPQGGGRDAAANPAATATATAAATAGQEQSKPEQRRQGAIAKLAADEGKKAMRKPGISR